VISVRIATFQIDIYDDNDGLWMKAEYDEESDSSSDEEYGESGRTDAVEDSSCQHPVFLYFILLVRFMILLVFIVNLSHAEVRC